MTRNRNAIGFLALSVVFACTDATSPPTAARVGERMTSELASAPDTWLKDYVSMGTSVSMGYASEGVWSGSQVNAWPAQLAAMAGYGMRLPLIAFPGCRSPFKAPLSSGIRESGEAVTTPDYLLNCAPLESGVTLPPANVAINAARTSHALSTTPENTTDLGNKALYARVLPPNTTQVMAMQMQKPAFVSVEFGANEMLGVRSGAVVPGVTYVPVSAWRPIYDEVTAKARLATSGGGVLVGLIKDLASFPAFRTGAEFWADRAMLLAAFHVQVDANCDQNTDLQLVPIKIPTAVANGLGRRQAQLPPYLMSCAPGPRGTQDLVLDAGERKIVQALLNEMNAHIARRAAQLGFAHFELEALYGLPNLKPPFSSVALMTTNSPYGLYISLDGFHPAALGQTVLAQAAARALNTTYGMQLTMLPVALAR
jgi:hypothetical protein